MVSTPASKGTEMPDHKTGNGHTFRIATWNVLYSNASGDRIADFLEATDADVAALQELSVQHLEHLERQGRWHLARSPDQTGAQTASFLGIVSKAPVVDQQIVDLPMENRPARSLFARLTATTGTQTALRARVRVGREAVEVLNLHLTCATNPEGRRRERAAALAALPADRPAVVLGDFNAMARRWINPAFAVPFGFRPRHLVLDERAELTAWAAGHGFAGTVQGITFPKLGLQLDQIFVRRIAVVSAQILNGRFGSDHRPVVVDLAV